MATLLSPAPDGRRVRLSSRILPLLLLLCALALPVRVHAQATSADTAAILLDAADRLSREGRGDASSALLAYVRAHFASTPAGMEAARRLAALPAPARARALSGRTELIVWGTTYGIALGVAIPAAAKANSSGAYGLGLLLGAPAGFAAARAYANASNVTDGEARAITFGGTWGAWQGYGMARVLGLLDRKVEPYCPDAPPGTCPPYEETSSQGGLTAAIVGSLAGVGAGAVVGNNLRITPGQAATVSLAALWGTWYGGATAGVLEVDGEKNVIAMLLAGGDAALAGAALAAPRWRLSRERARLISIVGLAGVLVGAGVDLLLQVDNAQAGFGIPLITGTIGLGVGAAMTGNMPPEAPEARVGPAGAPGGALLRVDGRRLGFGAPLPAPTLRRVGPRVGDLAPALYVPVLRANF